jgi:hypothetical protein
MFLWFKYLRLCPERNLCVAAVPNYPGTRRAQVCTLYALRALQAVNLRAEHGGYDRVIRLRQPYIDTIRKHDLDRINAQESLSLRKYF